MTDFFREAVFLSETCENNPRSALRSVQWTTNPPLAVLKNGQQLFLATSRAVPKVLRNLKSNFKRAEDDKMDSPDVEAENLTQNPKRSFQKNPRVLKIFIRNSGAENGCVNFMDAWKNALFLQENPCP